MSAVLFVAFLLLAVLSISSQAACKGSTVQGSNAFLADFSSAGVDEFFQMTMMNGYANYEDKLDLSTLTTTCDLSPDHKG